VKYMFDAISDLVRNVTIIVLIAGFLEMLLPQGEIKKFVKAVLGLFILVSILNPLLGLFDRATVNEVLAWQDPIQETMELNSILKEGEEISREMNEKAVEMYRQNMAKQIETVVKLVRGVVWAEAEVQMKAERVSSGYEAIEKVFLRVGTDEKEEEKGGIEKIKPINIKIDHAQEEIRENLNKPNQEEIKEQIVETLKNFYNFREEQIEINII